MIDSFFESWGLFGGMYLSGMGGAALLSFVGIYLVARNQIFAGAAIAQSSTLGLAISLLCHNSSYVMSIIPALVTCLIIVLGDQKNSQKGSERIIGWIFLFCMSMSILVVAHSPHGLENVSSLMSSGLIHAGGQEALTLWSLFIVMIILVKVFYKELIMIMTDLEMAKAVGLEVTRWLLIIALVLGFCIGTSVQSTGVLFSFSCLVLPAMAARHFCRTTKSVFFVTPLIAIGGVFLSLVVANHYDLPNDQTSCVSLCTLVLISWLKTQVWNRA